MANISKVRPLFRTMMGNINLIEHDKEFDSEEIPSTNRSSLYHIKSGDLIPTGANQHVHEFLYPITLKVFKRGYRNVSEAIDGADVIREQVFGEVLKASNRLGTAIKNIEPSSSSIATISESNDNSFVIEFNFECKLYECF